jgi:integrase
MPRAGVGQGERASHQRQQVPICCPPGAGKPAFLAPPKTAASIRTIPLPTVVVDVLARHLAAFAMGEGQLLFTNDRGEPISRTRFSEAVWQPAIVRAGLPGGTRFHDLRHYYASLLIRHGESVKVVQARLGHASASETLDTYSHLWPDSEDRARSERAVSACCLRAAGRTTPSSYPLMRIPT